MKKFLLFVLFISPFIITSCGPDGLFGGKPTPAPELPPITTEGLNTAGCLVNGEVWLPKSGGGFRPGIDCEYYPRIEGTDQRFWGTMKLDLSRFSNDHLEGDIIISKQSLFKTGSYPLIWQQDSLNLKVGKARYIDAYNSLTQFDNTFQGDNLLEILKLDTVNRIISGTFQFDAISEDNPLDTMKIRDGRFDVKFTY